MGPSGDLYMKSVSYQLVCAVEGYPLDIEKLKWSFKPCKLFEECLEKDVDQKPGNINVKISQMYR